jgi:hypothetical protein
LCSQKLFGSWAARFGQYRWRRRPSMQRELPI